MPRLVVVFGAAVGGDGSPSGTLRRRIRSAWLCGQQSPKTKYLVTGGIGASGYPEWAAMRSELMTLGVLSEDIVAEQRGTYTRQQVRYCIPIVRQYVRDGFSIWIATSSYHQARCWMLFAVNGIRTHLATPLPDRMDLPIRKLLWFWLRELLAVPYDLILEMCRWRT